MKLLRPIIPTEAQVLRSVLSALKHDTRIAWAGRFNSGAMTLGDGKTKRYLKFHSVPGFPDIAGQLKDGRFLALECKRPGWKSPKDLRECQQQEFIMKVKENNGVAGFVCSFEDVWRLLDNAECRDI